MCSCCWRCRDPWMDVPWCVWISSHSCDVSQVFSNFEVYNMIRLGVHLSPTSTVWIEPRKFDYSDFSPWRSKSKPVLVALCLQLINMSLCLQPSALRPSQFLSERTSCWRRCSSPVLPTGSALWRGAAPSLN